MKNSTPFVITGLAFLAVYFGVAIFANYYPWWWVVLLLIASWLLGIGQRIYKSQDKFNGKRN